MKLKSKFQILVLIPVCLILAAGLSLYLTNMETAGSREMERAAYEIVRSAFELNLATDQYLLHPEERPKIQFQSIYESLRGNLASARTRTEKEESILKSIEKNHQSVGFLFPLLVSLQEESRTGGDGDLTELRERIIGQLLTDLRQIESETVQLSRISGARLDAAQRWGAYSILLTILISGTGMLLFSYWIGKSTLMPIKNLHEATASITSGNLDHQVPVGGGDEIGRLSSAFNEMTDRLKTSYASIEDLKRAEARYRIVAENPYNWEFWSNPEGEYIYVSPSCKRITGCEPEDFMKDAELVRRIVHPEDLSVFDRHSREEAAAEEELNPAETIFRMVNKDGSLHWIGHTCKRVYNGDGRFLGIRGTNRDITPRVKAEMALRRSHAELEQRVSERTAELEVKNRELQEFAFVASHDLSEPLRKIQTFGTLLNEKSSDRLDEQAKDYLSRMTGAANRMQELLDALLRYSRIETQGHDFSRVKLVDVVQDAAGDLEVAIQEIGGSVEINSLPTVQGDPNQLRQLFQNLIANAVKYHRSEVKTTIRIHSLEGNEGCRILVEDNGIGFDEKYLEKIFQPFQRLHGRNEYPGTGMGLAICRKIVGRHGGTITARSKKGKGSTFIIELPVDQNETAH